jgi:hypothetical protein
VYRLLSKVVNTDGFNPNVVQLATAFNKLAVAVSVMVELSGAITGLDVNNPGPTFISPYAWRKQLPAVFTGNVRVFVDRTVVKN